MKFYRWVTVKKLPLLVPLLFVTMSYISTYGPAGMYSLQPRFALSTVHRQPA